MNPLSQTFDESFLPYPRMREQGYLPREIFTIFGLSHGFLKEVQCSSKNKKKKSKKRKRRKEKKKGREEKSIKMEKNNREWKRKMSSLEQTMSKPCTELW